MLRFIHCADLHVDSPFKGIGATAPELAQALYRAPFQAFSNIVDLALAEEVDFVVIAGDAFDSTEKSLHAQLQFNAQLERLGENGISCFYGCGNHDPLATPGEGIALPDNCHRFGSDDIEMFPVDKAGQTVAHVYGISFGKAAVYDNLALKFKRADMLMPSIGVLHCNIGKTGHEPYAPATVEDLCVAGMDYWALGHVHAFSQLREANPAIVYSGCSQGCTPRETGAHGCCLVTIHDNGDIEAEFKAADIVRFKQLEVRVANCEDMGDVISAINSAVEDFASTIEERNAVIRLKLTGKTALDQELRRGSNAEGVLGEARHRFEGREPFIWLERLTLATMGDYDLEELRMSDDFTAEIIRLYDDIIAGREPLPENIADELDKVFRHWRGSPCLTELSDDERQALCAEAMEMTLNRIAGGMG